MTDWFQEAEKRIDATQLQKGQDYQLDTDPFSNFRRSGAHFGLATYEAAEFNIVQKLERLKALRVNGRNPENEAVEDTYKDLAVYATLAYAMYLAEMAEKATAKSTDTDGSEPGQHDNAAQVSGAKGEVPERVTKAQQTCPDCGHFVTIHVLEVRPHPQFVAGETRKVICNAPNCEDNCATWNLQLMTEVAVIKETVTATIGKDTGPMMVGQPTKPGRTDLVVGAFDKETK